MKDLKYKLQKFTSVKVENKIDEPSSNNTVEVQSSKRTNLIHLIMILTIFLAKKSLTMKSLTKMNLYKIIFHVKFSIKNKLINKQKLLLTMFFCSSYSCHLLYDQEIMFPAFNSPQKHFVLYPFMVKSTLNCVLQAAVS